MLAILDSFFRILALTRKELLAVLKDPRSRFIIFLPPLLFWESITAPTDVMRANAGWITSLAIGLVIATTGVVAVVAHAAIPGLGWPMAFVLGAIVAPTDELASAPVLERLRMPRHLVAVVEGESLLNDASSLILYATAVAAVVTGAFNPGIAVLQFFGSAIGGVLVGVACAWLAIETWRRVRAHIHFRWPPDLWHVVLCSNPRPPRAFRLNQGPGGSIASIPACRQA